MWREVSGRRGTEGRESQCHISLQLPWTGCQSCGHFISSPRNGGYLLTGRSQFLFLLGKDGRSKCTICQHRILSIAIWIMSCTPLSFQRCLMLMQGVLQPSAPGTLSISAKGRIMAPYKGIPQMPRFSDGLLPEPFWCLEHQVIRILMRV